ncbi:CHAT domain-containing protein [Nitrospira sp. NS4]|uniref:CHAT domain-containing protein n=1 Tax=Nitrospira sp. NS4 TaxID=3414498 RepID=UPI003C3082E9
MRQFHAMTSTLSRLLLVLLALTSLILTRTSGTFAAVAPSPEALMQQGAQAYQRGAFEQALAAWKEAARLYERDGKTGDQIEALTLSARAAQTLGQTSQALLQLDLALVLSQKHGDPLVMAGVLAHLGRTYLAARQLAEAAERLNEALELARRHNSPSLAAATLNDLGVLQAIRRQDREALASFQESATIAQDARLPLVAITAQINAARAELRLGKPQGSRLFLDHAFEQIWELPPSHDKAVGLINIGLGYGQLPALLPAISAPLLLRAAGVLQESVALSEQLGDMRSLSYGLGYLGHLYETEYRTDEALRLTRRAVFAAQSAGAPESLYRWQWQLGRLQASSRHLDEAIASYRQAAATLQPIRPEVARASYNASSQDQESVRPLFVELADLLLQRAGLTKDPPAAQTDLLAARDAIEAFKAVELREYFRDDCVDALQARIARLDTLSPTTAVIYPILFADRLDMLVSLPTGMTRISVPVPAVTLSQEVRAFRRTVEKRTTREYLPHAQRLYDWLVRPIEAELTRLQIHTLVFVPDGALRTIPLAALHDGSEFLIQKFAVALTPGITLTDPHPLNREKIRFLATGLTKGVQGFPPLPYVAEEMDSIHTLYASDQLLNQDFLTAKLEQELRAGRYGILHIATHGKFSTDANDSFLLTFDGRLTMNKLDQLIGLFRFRDDPLELLTLSACQTGIGDDRAALGLAGVAIKAGARSALATLWFINDEASAALMAEFYRELRDPSRSKAVALQHAQQKLLSDRVYEHPAYWSPFLLLNNWL